MANTPIKRLPNEQPPTDNPRALAEYLARQTILFNAIIKGLEERIEELENP